MSMKKKLCVAVIDSGVNEEDSYLKNTEIKNLYYEEREFKTCYAGKLNPHGTEVIKVLLKEAPDIRILSIRTLREDNRCMISAIINSIRYCIDERVDIINLSLGSCGPTARRLKDLRDICDEATDDSEEFCKVSYEDKIVEFSDNMVYVPDLTKCIIRRGNSYLCPLLVGIFCRFIDDKKICKKSILEFMDFLVEFGKAENISKIFFDKYNVMEQHSLDHKKMLYFADDMDLNNMQIYGMYKEVNGADLCFKEVYGKSDKEILEVISSVDVFYIGALSNQFIHENKAFLDNLIALLLGQQIEIVTVFPIANTFERIQLTDKGGFIKSIYK